MWKKRSLRAIALALCLAVAVPAALAEDWLMNVDAPVDEQAETALAAPEGDEPAEEAPIEDGEAGETPEDGGVPDRVFSETAVVESETWESLNLKRAKGFKGPLAQVNGLLKLSNIDINGAPAPQANLLKYFTLGPTGRIALVNDGPLALSLSAFSFNKGDSRTLEVYWNGKKLKAKKAKWTSADSGVVKVSSPGKLTAKKKGSAAVTVSYKGESATCRVVVTHLVPVKSVKLSAGKAAVSMGNTAKLTAKIRPDNASDKALVWASDKPSVATVDENGRVTGVAEGVAKITATAANGKSAACTVTVKQIRPKRVDFAQLFINLNPGKSFATKVRFTPEDTSDKALRYRSSDKSVVTVDEDGVLTAVGCGRATVTATAQADGGVKNTCEVCVIEPDAARMEGLIIGINPGHQIKTNYKKLPIAPGSHETAKAIKTGACGKWTRVNEYETNLQIGLKLREKLVKAGATVVITRTQNDVNLTNIERAKMLNEAGVDVALQLHCDSVKDSRREGCTAFVRSTGDWVEESRALAKALANGMSRQTGCVNRGTKVYNKYMSLNWTTTPTVLLEMGYLSNRKEDALLASDDYRDKMAEGILEGLCAYFGR